MLRAVQPQPIRAAAVQRRSHRPDSHRSCHTCTVTPGNQLLVGVRSGAAAVRGIGDNLLIRLVHSGTRGSAVILGLQGGTRAQALDTVRLLPRAASPADTQPGCIVASQTKVRDTP